MYPIVFIDGIRIKVRDSGVATNKVAHLVVGVDIDGYKHVLGIWLQAGGEGAKFWLNVFTELRNRGLKDALIVCCDGLPGLPDAVEAIWPEALIQTSSVHDEGGGRVPLVTCAASVRTCANRLPSRSRCRPVRLGRWRALYLPAGAAPI